MAKTLRFRVDVLNEKAAAVGDTTRLAIAKRTGVRESTISRLMTARTTPTLATLAAIAGAYGTSLDDLVVGVAPPVGAVPVQREAAA